MNSDVVALLGGLLFLLLALVGGGFTIKEISMPTIPSTARAACLVVGVALVVLSFVPSLRDGYAPAADDGPTTGNVGTTASSGDSSQPGSGEFVVRDRPEPVLAQEDGIEVLDLVATGPQKPLLVGDVLTVRYTLRNAGSSPFTFAEVFTGTIPPEGVDEDPPDAGHDNQGRVLAPGESLHIEHLVTLYGAGTWTIWPCYEKQNPDGSISWCPDTWNHFFATVE